MKMRIAAVPLSMLVAATSPALAPRAGAETVVLKAARLVDGRGGAPLSPAMVRVEGDRIVEVGRQLAVAPGARVLDLGDSTLLPGFIDLHTHLTGRPDVHWEEALVKTTPPDDALWGAHFARLTLLAGFTTCRDMGPNWPYVDVALRNAIEQGAVIGPRLLVAGNYVSSTGGAGDARQFSIYVDVPLVRNLADGPEEIVKAVRTNFKHGADFIKILATGAVLSKGIPPGSQQYSDQEIQAAVVEARRWGRQVAAHAHGTEGIKAAIRAGCAPSTTARCWTTRPSALLKGSTATYYVPTLYISKTVVEDPIVPASEKQRARELREKQIAVLQEGPGRGPLHRPGHGRARDAPRPEREGDRLPGLPGREPDERDRVRHPRERRDPRLVRSGGHGGGRQVGRPRGRPRRPAAGHRPPRAGGLRDEGRASSTVRSWPGARSRTSARRNGSKGRDVEVGPRG